MSRPGGVWGILLRAVVPRGKASDGLLGDLDEEYRSMVEAGRGDPSGWYRRQARQAVFRYVLVRMGTGFGELRRFLKGFGSMDRWTTEFALAARRLGKARAFSIIAIATLALGVGANASIFTVLNGVVLQPLPFDQPEELVDLAHRAPGLGLDRLDMSSALFLIYEEQSQALESAGLYNVRDFNVTGIETPLRIRGSEVSAGLFETLGIAPVMGRDFLSGDNEVGADPVVMLSHPFWVDRLGKREGIVGSTVELDGVSHTVVGVMPESFDFPTPEFDVWTPVTLDPEQQYITNFSFRAVGRLAEGYTAEAARADLKPLTYRSPEVYPGQIPREMLEQAELDAVVTPYRELVVGDVDSVLWLLLGTVGMVLMIAAANVANLFLVRSEGRQREVAVRTALGASTGDLARMFIAESLVVSFASALIALAVAWGAVNLLVAMGPTNLPRLEDIHVDVLVAAFAFVLSMLSGLVFALLPLTHVSRSRVSEHLREGGRSATTGKARNRLRSSLVVGQVTLAVVLLIGSGLLVRSFSEIRSVDPGFRSTDVLTMQLAPADLFYPDQDSRFGFYDGVREAVAGVPGVEAAGLVSILPLDGTNSNGLWIEGIQSDLPFVHEVRTVAGDYFEVLGIRAIAGRLLDLSDTHNDTRNLVVSAALAREHWGGTREALGQQIRFGSLEAPTWTVVGVSSDVRAMGLTEPEAQLIYMPARTAGGWSRTMSLVVRTSAAPLTMVEPVRAAVAGIDARTPLANIRTLEQIVEDASSTEAFTAFLLTVASLLALFLGAVGVYGVISYIFAQRIPEMGLRIALGARASAVFWIVLSLALKVLVIGIVLGLVVAALGSSILESMLFGVSARDATVFLAVPGVLLAVGLLASMLPAARAVRVDPAEVLRAD